MNIRSGGIGPALALPQPCAELPDQAARPLHRAVAQLGSVIAR